MQNEDRYVVRTSTACLGRLWRYSAKVRVGRSPRYTRKRGSGVIVFPKGVAEIAFSGRYGFTPR